MKHLSENTVKYMNQVWGFEGSGQVDDIAMFWDNAEYEMVAKRLVDAGAVEANCKEAKEMIKIAKSIKTEEEDEIIDELLKKHTILECKHCNNVHFIPQWCDAKDWTSCDSCGKNPIK